MSGYRRPSAPTPPCRVPGVAPRRRAADDHVSNRVMSSFIRAGKVDVLVDLVRSLVDAGRTKVTKDFEELVVEPFSDPDPKPLVGLVPPSELADPDSKFVTIEIDGVEIEVHYKESIPESSDSKTSPNIDALICLHGANGSTYSFRHLLPRVAKETGVRAIAIDRPPYGLTTRPLPPNKKSENQNKNVNQKLPDYHRVYTPEGAVEFTLKVMDALGVENAALLGHSAGAPVALDTVLHAPERCAMLLAIAPAVFVGDASDDENDDDAKAKKRVERGIRASTTETNNNADIFLDVEDDLRFLGYADGDHATLAKVTVMKWSVMFPRCLAVGREDGTIRVIVFGSKNGMDNRAKNEKKKEKDKRVRTSSASSSSPSSSVSSVLCFNDTVYSRCDV